MYNQFTNCYIVKSLDRKIAMKITKSKILKYLQENDLMSLATSLNDKPWSCALLFVNDKDFNFYIYSAKNTLHCKQFKKNPKVAFSVNHESSKGDFEGLQISGQVVRFKIKEMPKVIKMFIKKYPYSKSWFGKDKIKQLISKVAKSQFYKIKATKIYYLEKDNLSERRLFKQ